MKVLTRMFWRAIPLILLMMLEEAAYAQDYLNIDAYKCSDFLSDSAKPDNPQKLIRSLVMIAWAAGYAASHQQKHLRADVEAMRLVAGVAGEACRKNPGKLAFEAIVEAINKSTSVGGR